MPFSPAYHVVYGAYSEYLRYLEMGADRVKLPEHKHDPANSVGKVHASALGSCPLKNALRRQRAPQTNPPSHAERTSTLHLMQQGTRDAEPIQEALVWKYGEISKRWKATPSKTRKGHLPTDRSGAAVEVSVEHENFKVRGRIDATVRPSANAPQFIFEIKRRDATGGKGDPQPKLSDVWQLMTYGAATGIHNLNLVIINRYVMKVWTLYPVRDGFVLKDEKGERWANPLNSPEHLNYEKLEQEIALQLTYLNGKTDCPMPDFLNDDRNGGWYCFHWVDGVKPMVYARETKGKMEKLGYITPRCEYFCQPQELIGAPVRETSRESGIYEFVKPAAEEPAA